MQSAPAHPAERERLAQLHSMGLLDTGPEESFDRITRLAMAMCGTPVALISLVDHNRQWFKSRQGLSATETARDVAFCSHAILDERPLVVEDARLDPRFDDNPLVTGAPNVIFYAGIPLKAPGGMPMGTLCVIDHEARTIDADVIATLHDLALLAEDVMALGQLALLDPLTGLHNRRGLLKTGELVLALADRERRPLSAVYLDIDGLKATNDEHGHEAGDRLITTMADLLRSSMRGADTIARVGGDEFAALLLGADEHGVPHAMQRLTDQLAARNQAALPGLQLSASIGWASRAPGGIPLDELVAQADEAMLAVKDGSPRAGGRR